MLIGEMAMLDVALRFRTLKSASPNALSAATICGATGLALLRACVTAVPTTGLGVVPVQPLASSIPTRTAATEERRMKCSLGIVLTAYVQRDRAKVSAPATRVGVPY